MEREAQEGAVEKSVPAVFLDIGQGSVQEMPEAMWQMGRGRGVPTPPKEEGDTHFRLGRGD